jgi:type IV pilus assembly protein PilA
MKKSFTLIELLVVVAIIGILAAIGTPIFQGFIQNAKIAVAQENHIRVRDFIATSFTKCSAGSGYIELLRRINCSKTASQMNDEFAYYFDKAGFKNPYDSSVWGVAIGSTKNNNYFKKTGTCAWLGTTYLFGSGNKIRICTKISDDDGVYVFLNDIIVKE